MRRLFAYLLLAVALLAAPAFAATSLDVARANQAAARARVNGIRAQQMSWRSELNEVARRIEALKAQQKGALLKGGELDASLRRSQELSGLLTSAAQDLAGAEAALEQENLSLLGALTAELEGLRREWDRSSDRAARADVLRRMRAVRAEREQVRAMLPAARVPALDLHGSDDAEDLLEQADALRDAEDKVRQQMRSLQARIAELRREQELDRRMNDFLAEESLFDEQDRRMRRASPQVRAVGADVLRGNPETQSDPAGGPEIFGTQNEPPAGPPAPPPTIGSVESAPVVGEGAAPLDEMDPRVISALEARLKELESLARDLDKRANEAKAKAGGAR